MQDGKRLAELRLLAQRAVAIDPHGAEALAAEIARQAAEQREGLRLTSGVGCVIRWNGVKGEAEFLREQG